MADGSTGAKNIAKFSPPSDVSSDFYPILGAYSVNAQDVVAQHFAWLRQAGVGLIITSWWGIDSFEDRAVPLLLQMGERYGVKVAFHLEPYYDRTAASLVNDIEFLYDRYGHSPAFYRSSAPSPWVSDGRQQGLFFLYASSWDPLEQSAVDPSYWLEAMETVHSLPDGGRVIADTPRGDFLNGAHFDGAYPYLSRVDLGEDFAWARCLSPGSWYVPSVAPGYSSRRILYPEGSDFPRQNGDTYSDQWEAALGVNVEPAIVTITSFNEWHEGTQIEPAASGATNDLGYRYKDYESLPPEGYLHLTRQWVEQLHDTVWQDQPPSVHRVRIRLRTSSDWTSLRWVDGTSLCPSRDYEVSDEGEAFLEQDAVHMGQPIANAERGNEVEVVFDAILVGKDGGATFRIDRGHLGSTTVEFHTYEGVEPALVETIVWSGINLEVEENSYGFEVSTAGFAVSTP